MLREELLSQLTHHIISLECSHPLRVAINGIDASGKTTLSAELASQIEAQGRPVIRASIDDFHRPRRERYQRGANSPEGYYEDAFNFPTLQKVLLAPLGPQGDRRYRRAIFDVRTDTPLPIQEEMAPADAILLVDGVFLLRPELDAYWDYRIFVNVDFGVALQRVMERDLYIFGSPDEVRTRYLQRYYPGQNLYFQHAQPHKRADVIIENTDPTDPQLIFPS